MAGDVRSFGPRRAAALFSLAVELPVREGALISGKYLAEGLLGEGGMGFVVAAFHVELGERVALKFLLPEAAKNPEASLRFVREARAAAKIKGEHVARVLDVGTHDGMPFIVMEYLEGVDLARLVETRGALAVSDAAHYLLQACEAVAQAHAVGIVHRDLKPSNLFLTKSPDAAPLVKVLDFGISKATSVFARTLSPDITTVNAAVGTPQYMSPEQARDAGKVDARADVWALGAILYELLAGKPAFDGDDVPAIIMMIATEEPPPLEALRPDIPAGLAAVVHRCLRKQRDERFADIAELASALEPFVPAEARRSVVRIARILGHDSLPPPATVDASSSARERRTRPTAVLLGSAVALALLAAFFASKRLASPPGAPPAFESNSRRAAVTEPVLPASVATPRETAPVRTAELGVDFPARNPTPSSPSPSKEPTLGPRPRRTDSARSRDALSAPKTPEEIAVLRFEANVPAEVALDGRSLGQTPKSVTAAPGSHTVVFVHPALGEKSHVLTLASGEEKTIRATFEPRTSE